MSLHCASREAVGGSRSHRRAGMTGRSGTALLAEVADTIGFTDSLERAVNGCRSWAGHPPGKVVRDLVVMLADGGDALRHLKVLGGDDQQVLFGPVASAATANRTIVAPAEDELVIEPGPDCRREVVRPLRDRQVGPGAGQHCADRDPQHRHATVPNPTVGPWIVHRRQHRRHVLRDRCQLLRRHPALVNGGRDERDCGHGHGSCSVDLVGLGTVMIASGAVSVRLLHPHRRVIPRHAEHPDFAGALLTRKEGTTPEQFRQHWLDVHGPLARRACRTP